MEVINKFENAKRVMETCEHSQLVIESRKQHIKLAPKYIGSVQKGVHNQLTELLSHPDKRLDGFPVAYNNVQLLQRVGKVISDQTCVHFDIQADFIMFKPVIGCKLNGKVNKVAKRHIGCLVHNNFNAWVPHTASTEKIAVDLLMGSDMEFTVQDISTNRNVLSIKGKFEKFLSQNLQKAMEPTKQGKMTGKVKDQTTNDNNKHDDKEIASPITKKKKKHQKDVVEPSLDETGYSQNETQLSETLNSENDEQPPKTKKKRKKDNKKTIDVNESVIGGIGGINDSVASLTSCEPLLTSTQVDDLNNNSTGKVNEKKHKKKKKHERIDESDNDRLLQSNPGNSTEATERVTVEDISDRVFENNGSVQVISKSRKRRHEDNTFTKLKESVNDLDLAAPSPVKKHKKHKKKTLETIDFDSSVDFEDTSSSRVAKKEKKKKKHKEKLD